MIDGFCRENYYLAEESKPFYFVKARSAPSDSSIESLSKIIHSMLLQPWFTSLWTLQEAYLCKSAILLSRSPKPVLLTTVIHETFTIQALLNWFLVYCRDVFTACLSRNEEIAYGICQHLLNSGQSRTITEAFTVPSLNAKRHYKKIESSDSCKSTTSGLA